MSAHDALFFSRNRPDLFPGTKSKTRGRAQAYVRIDGMRRAAGSGRLGSSQRGGFRDCPNPRRLFPSRHGTLHRDAEDMGVLSF